ncbi:hypothetical protein ACH4U6_19260 [Streptomyces netropsis]|uniref:hypothetical protein n=1 Tax=Streptomyces netropsis TaxID=55404 RepID=UPI0037B7AFDD
MVGTAGMRGGPGAEVPRRAGVSAFGLGGVNAHAVVEEYVGDPRRAADVGPGVFVLSAKSEERLAIDATGLDTQRASFARWVSGAPVPWHLLRPHAVPRRVPAPTHPFARERYRVRVGERFDGGQGAP